MPQFVDWSESNEAGLNKGPACLLELAAKNDLSGFSEAIRKGAEPDSVGSWYCRIYGASRAASEQRTPVMIAALYGSLDVLRFLLHYYYHCNSTTFGLDINRRCGADRSTALHCAVMGGSTGVVETVRLLLESGASSEVVDAKERRPVDVIMLPHKVRHAERAFLEVLLAKEGIGRGVLLEKEEKYSVGINISIKRRPVDVTMLSHNFGHAGRADSEGLLAIGFGRGVLPEKEEKYSVVDISEKQSPVDVITLSHKSGHVARANLEGLLAKGVGRVELEKEKNSVNVSERQSPIDVAMLSHKSGHLPSAISNGLLAEEIGRGVLLEKEEKYSADVSEKPWLPDIKNNIYSTDEFRMFSFKVRPCSRAYSHDWTECPFAHPGENARRRDPRKHEYSYIACPDFRKAGSCRRGDACGHAHGVFECWLHPAQYRTRLCKDSTACTRKVCFFAHSTNELRKPNIPLHPSTSPPSVLDLQSAFSHASYTNPLNIDISELYKSQLLDDFVSVSLSGSLSSPCPSNLEDAFAYNKPADSSPSSNIWTSIQIPGHIYPREEYQRSRSCRDLQGSRIASDWGSPVGKPKWAVDGDELSKLRKSTSFARYEEEPDLPWLGKEGAMVDMVYW